MAPLRIRASQNSRRTDGCGPQAAADAQGAIGAHPRARWAGFPPERVRLVIPRGKMGRGRPPRLRIYWVARRAGASLGIGIDCQSAYRIPDGPARRQIIPPRRRCGGLKPMDSISGWPVECPASDVIGRRKRFTHSSVGCDWVKKILMHSSVGCDWPKKWSDMATNGCISKVIGRRVG